MKLIIRIARVIWNFTKMFFVVINGYLFAFLMLRLSFYAVVEFEHTTTFFQILGTVCASLIILLIFHITFDLFNRIAQYKSFRTI